MSYTFSIIKPDSTESGVDNQILSLISLNMFKIKGIKRTILTKEKAEQFYAIHKDKDFFADLIRFMTSGPIVVLAIESTNAVERFRKFIGDTDPKEAEPNTIRAKFGTDIGKNAIHGADSDENAKREIVFFFPELISTLK
jgi:nucleoside-diphosphate kinase